MNRTPEELRIYKKEQYKIYRQTHLEQINAKSREWSRTHPEISRERQKRWRQENPEKAREKYNRYARKNPDKIKAFQKKYRETHKEELLARRTARRDQTNKKRRERNQATKEEVIIHYGKICQCCGESKKEFLCIDHINGGGNKHRKEIESRGSYSMYQWLKKNNFPNGFQVLCHNCNMAKGIYGICPHQTINKQIDYQI
jgi:hypothetical protein